MRLLGEVLRALGTFVLVCTVVLWAAMGLKLGWTKTYVEIDRVDPVTELPFKENVPRFIPGVDFLAAGVFSGIVLLLVSIPLTKLKSYP